MSSKNLNLLFFFRRKLFIFETDFLFIRSSDFFYSKVMLNRITTPSKNMQKTNLGEALRKNSQTSRVPRSPFDSFSRISFKKTTLGAELAFRNLRATLTNRIEPFYFFLVIKSKKKTLKNMKNLPNYSVGLPNYSVTELFFRRTDKIHKKSFSKYFLKMKMSLSETPFPAVKIQCMTKTRTLPGCRANVNLKN